LDQTYPNLEIIISDNCSNDGTETLVKSFADSRTRYIKQKKNIGANNNFNYCVEQARGVYFLLLHDDDLIDSDFIEVCLKAANYREDVGLIRTGMRRIDSNGKTIRENENLVNCLSTDAFFLGWFTGKTPMHLCNTIFNTRRLKEIGGFQSKHNVFQDVFAEVILAAKFGRVDIRAIKASFRSHPSQITNAVHIKSWCEDSLILLDTICKLATENSTLLREVGLRFFSNHNYKIASTIKSPLQRFFAYVFVFRSFNCQTHYFVNRAKRKIRKIIPTT
jgi:glycosyltransferase involved in cell wall biosynthesis